MLKVSIICPTHGIYEQIPNSHLQGRGCPLCSGTKAKSATAKSEFTTKASIVHNNRYSYELVSYKNNATKIKTTCKDHGVYEQTPKDHLSGNGCPNCALLEKGWSRTHFKDKCTKNNNSKGILYVLECYNDNETFIKIRNNQ